MTPWLYPVEAGLVRADLALEVISPAYDLLTPDERSRHAQRHPLSFLNGTPSSETEDPGDDAPLRRKAASSYLAARLAENVWEFRSAALYVYRIDSDGHRQTGVVGDVPAIAFPDRIRPHEGTRSSRVEDLADYLELVGFGSSPVGLTYRPRTGLDALVTRIVGGPPQLDVVLADGERHTVWAVTEGGMIEDLQAGLAEIEAAYIVDGHHRVAATLRRGTDPAEPSGRFLAVAFPADQLAVHPFHRWVGVDWRPDGSGSDHPLEPRPGVAVAVTRAGEWECHLGSGEDDATALAAMILGPRLGLADERTDSRLVFIPGYPGPEALRSKVARQGGVGFLLHPPSVSSIMAVSDRGDLMPPKATYFAPKPRSGVFLVHR